MTDSSLDALLSTRPTSDEVGEGVPLEATVRQRVVARAVRAWTDLMMDRTGRNSLLKFRSLTKGTLELRREGGESFDQLLRGRTVAIEQLAAAADTEVPARGRTIYRKAQENFEERGIVTLHVACGLATWTTDGPWEPSAPVVLLGARLVPRGALLDGFDLQLTGAVEINPTLTHVLRTEHGVRIEPEVLYAKFDGELDEEGELTEALEWMRQTCAGVAGFAIDARRVLGNFAFAKLPMIHDLETMVETLAGHDVIAAVAGSPEAQAALIAQRAVDQDAPIPDFDHIAPVDEFLVLDTDSTQNTAINRVISGASLIVKGPPGTGKSQTISNLIATLAARGQTVLFVAEKRAAIDAVTKRLDQRELGELVLDVHSGIGTRKQFAGRMREALSWMDNAAQVDATKLHEALVRTREDLHESSDALHEVRTPWGVSLYGAFCGSMEAGAEVPIRLTQAQLAGTDAAGLDACALVVRELAQLGGIGLDAGASPWRGAAVTTEAQAARAQELLIELRQSRVREVRRRVAEANASTGVVVATTIEQLSLAAGLLERSGELCARYTDAAWEAPLDEIRGALDGGRNPFAHVWRVMFSGGYRRARTQLRAFVRPGAEPAKLPRTAAVALCELRDAWRTSGSTGHPRPFVDLPAFAAAATQLRDALTAFAALAGAPALLVATFDEIEGQLTAYAGDLPTLAKLPRIRTLTDTLEIAGFEPALDHLAALPTCTADNAERVVRGVWHRSVIDAITLGDPRLTRMSADRLNAARAQFAEADSKHIDSTSARVRRACAARALQRRNDHPEANALLERQASLKTRHKPVRALIDETMPVLLGVKPCWVMSPLMVSQLLPQRQVFDVVIFDEASQIMPQDAVAAIARGRQLVVAGDERQLPPTAFFGSVSAEDIEVGDENSASADDGLPTDDGSTTGYESILDALQPVLPFRQLGWHYRSKDERLIAFSNAYIYGGTLTTFPGAWADAPISHVLVPSDPARPTAKGSAPLEVERVVELVIDHARTRPTESLGVITMGIEHAMRIEAALLGRRRDEPDLAAFFDEGLEERFFVKNLERVQGDERDAIILSIGYGKDERGQLPYRFGPLLTEGGERRLNVAVTRAKRRMTLVSSFAFEDMEAGRSSARGVELLREYLRFAASGGADVGAARALEHPLNPFELDVARGLEARGLSLDAQHGASGYRIDFAARHPQQPGRFVLAIECDGATYHASPAARDRDRLRQEHLERLGWTFHRIWSTDWFHDPELAATAAVAAFERAVAALTAGDAASPLAPASLPVPDLVPDVQLAATARGARPPITPGAPITEYSDQQLVDIVRWVRADGALRTDESLMAEIRELMGFRRRGTRIDAALARAISCG